MKKNLPWEEVMDLMSTVNDKLSPRQIQYFWHHPEKIDMDKDLTEREKQRLKEEFEES